MEKRRKGSGAVRFMRGLTILLALTCLGLGAYVFLFRETSGPPPAAAERFAPRATFARGVSVSGVALGGMNMDEAIAALTPVERELAAQVHFILDARGYSLTLTAADMPVIFDTAQLLNQALLNSADAGEDDLEAGAAADKSYEITRSVDVEPIRGIISELSANINTAPTDAAVEMDMNVDGWFRYTEGKAGETLDEEALLETIRVQAEAGEFGLVTLPVSYTQPAVTVDMLKASLTERGTAYTSFKKSPYNREDRVYNVKRAANLINGSVLKPGEVFSTNDTLGDRTYELGWKPAPAYVRGTTEDQAGGGVCQASSTLYAAAVKADLEIVYRRNHSSYVDYIPRGLDATINTGTIDFTFKNNTGSDIYIFAYTIDSKDGTVPEDMEDKTIHIEIFGEDFPDEYDEIRLTAEKVETLKPSSAMEIIVDTTVASDYYNEEVQRKDGAVYQSYKHYYKNDVEVRQESLAKSTYKAYGGRVVVGTGYYGDTQSVISE